ncbi:MAG: hypothetical protein JWN86_4616 [Planctomycetota bacterium]|nr:hypothetical protein [Planctomycetota bacterium]
MVFHSSAIGGVLLVGLLAGTDPGELVARLGSPKYADREAASSALEKLGQSAFPALKVARNDHDPEVKSRAELLLDSIERSMLNRPATLRLEARRYTLPELAERLGKSQGVPLPLGEVGGREGRARSFVELQSPETLAFWDILDRVGLVPQWEFEQEFGRPTFRKASSVKLVPRNELKLPSITHGPFRLTANPLTFEEEPSPVDLMARRGLFQQPPRLPRPQTPRETDLVVSIGAMVEPRLAVRSFGSVRLLECVDDNGQAIAPVSRPALDPVASFGIQDRGQPPASFQIRLRPPTTPAKAIQTLRGVVSVEIEARKIEPTVISLNAQSLSERRPIDCGGMRLQVQGLTPKSPAFRAGYTLDLAIQPEGWVAPVLPRRMGGNRRGPWDAPKFDPEFLLQNLEVVDAQGQPFTGGRTIEDGFDAEGVRIRLFLPARDGVDAPPTGLRVHGHIRAAVEIPFEFKDLKLPGGE